jgi:hypothetical protein
LAAADLPMVARANPDNPLPAHAAWRLQNTLIHYPRLFVW